MTEVNAAAAELMVCANCTAASHKLMISNWRNVMAVNRFGIAMINVGRSIERSMRKSAKSRRHYCMIENYSHNPMRPIMVNVLSASCRYHLIGVNLCFGHAAAKSFVLAVFMLIT